MSEPATDASGGWHRLGAGAWLFRGRQFRDDRGHSEEICDLSTAPSQVRGFTSVQENLIATHAAGTARGMHYQLAPLPQAKLVTVITGTAQFFWLALRETAPAVNSIVLSANAGSLYTPADCAHGFLAVEDGTQFLLKMSAPISLAERAEFSFGSTSLTFDFARPLRQDLLSPRDRDAPDWTMRRQ